MSNKKGNKFHERHNMEKATIKRVKRNKKHISTKEKIIAGVGVGSTLLGGGIGVGGAKPSPSQAMVSTQKDSSNNTAGKIKDFLKKTFGVPKAKAFMDTSGVSSSTGVDFGQMSGSAGTGMLGSFEATGGPSNPVVYYDSGQPAPTSDTPPADTPPADTPPVVVSLPPGVPPDSTLNPDDTTWTDPKTGIVYGPGSAPGDYFVPVDNTPPVDTPPTAPPSDLPGNLIAVCKI